ncbi:MAG: 4-hydroxyphenylpyruvate dioxygenase [Pseudonocardiaceae bacterium]
MSSERARIFQELRIDHIKFYVADIGATLAELVRGFGFDVYARATEQRDEQSVAIGKDHIRLVLTRALVDDHPGAVYLTRHGDGVADIALGAPDAPAAFAEAVRRGACPVEGPVEREGTITASVLGFGDVLHTFVQRRDGAEVRHLPGFAPARDGAGALDSGLRSVDHFAVCLEAGQLEPTVQFYERVLDFRMTFTERIIVGSQEMNSKVVQSASGAVTLTLIEPDTGREPGQIDEFVKNHGGAGVQHIAFETADIVRSIRALRSGGIEFLSIPDVYYELLGDRLELTRHPVADLGELNILADEDHAGQLFQIFAKSAHPRATLFFEVIERFGATTFGSGNIKALYEAVEAERIK